MNTSPAAIAYADQVQAAKREAYTNVAGYIAQAVVVAGIILGIWAYAIAAGALPAAPWSPIGQLQQVDNTPPPSQQAPAPAERGESV